jgi:hypothetical protein
VEVLNRAAAPEWDRVAPRVPQDSCRRSD